MKALITLFLCDDVMTGPGVDQIMRRSVDPVLLESYVKNAQTYVEIAERVSGPIPDRVKDSCIWGDALGILARKRPAARIITLENSINTSNTPWPAKEIHYRMQPDKDTRLRIFAYGLPSAGVPPMWQAGAQRPGMESPA